MIMKRFFILIIVIFIAVPIVMGQTANSSREMTVEEAYMQEMMEMMIIRETSRVSSREQKLIALEYVGNVLDRGGNVNEEIRLTLEYLSLEGTQNKVRERGRLMNDYPEVRREAARYLGVLGTAEAKTALIRICTIEAEPMVLQEAIKSLGHIGMNENDETVNAIVWVADKFNNTTAPDNLLALSAIDALDRIAAKNNGLTNPNVYSLLIRISEGSYAQPVRERAKQALIDFRKYMLQGFRE